MLTIEKRPLTVQAAADDKEVYDGTAETTGTVRLGNAVLGDAPTATASFIFDSPDVGVNKTVHVTGIRLAEDENDWAAHYVLEQDTATVQASIRKKQRVELRLVGDSLVQEYGSVTGAVADGPEDARIVTRYAGKEELPVLPGEYEVQAALEDRNRFGSVKGCFTVRPKQVSIQGLLVPEID